MDLATIRRKLEAGDYMDLMDFVSDVRLVFQNCRTLNPEGSLYWRMGETMSDYFEALLQDDIVAAAAAAASDEVAPSRQQSQPDRVSVTSRYSYL